MRFGRRPAGADVHPDDLDPGTDAGLRTRTDDRPGDRHDDVEDTIRLDDLPWSRTGPEVPQQPGTRASGTGTLRPGGSGGDPDSDSATEVSGDPNGKPSGDPSGKHGGEQTDARGAGAGGEHEGDAEHGEHGEHGERGDDGDLADVEAADGTAGDGARNPRPTRGVTDGGSPTDLDTEDTAPVEMVRRGEPAEPAVATWAERYVPPEPEPESEPRAPRPSTGATVAGPAVATSRRRFLRRRWARRWGVWRRLVVALVLAALVLTGVWLVFFSSVLAVSGVQVTGTQRLSADVVRRAAAGRVGGPLATADLGAVAARVEAIPAVESVDVSRAWPDRVRLDVTERRAVAVVTSGSGLRGVDATGVVFDHYAARPPGMPLVRRTATTDRDALAEAAAVAASLPADLSRRVAYVSVATVDRISLGLRSGRTVQWGSSEESADKARVLDALLGQKATSYDVSVPDQPVIRK